MPWTKPKASTTARGYGHTHRLARAAAARRHRPFDPCARCHHPLGPMSKQLHYDHDGTRTGYLGFSHAHCNVKAGAREGRARQTRQHLRTVKRRALLG